MDEVKVFSDVKFVLAECVNADAVKTILIEGGAKHLNYLSDHVTLVIADKNCPEAEEAVELYDKPVVSSKWVHLSLRAKKLLPTEAFSPTKSIFHQVVASFSSDLSKNDIDILAATMTFYGAKVSKDISCSTHFIVAKTDPSDLPDQYSHLKIIAPDWVTESIRQNSCCDEQLYDPSLLVPPKPPTPSPPPPPPPQLEPLPQVEKDKPEQKDEQDEISQTNAQQTKIDNKPTQDIKPQLQPQNTHTQSQTNLQKQHSTPFQPQQQQPQPQMQSQLSHPSHQVQTLPSQLPRPRVHANVIRGIQHKFRPLIPPNNNVPMQPRSMAQPARVMVPETQQPRKVTINIEHRKPGPYQNSMDPQQHVPMHHQHPNFTQPQHIQLQSQQTQQPTVGIVQTTARLPQPNIYHQVRQTYQNSHVQPKVPTHQQTMLNQQQHLHQPQPPSQMINRFQDPNTHPNQRPYQVNLQPQPVNPNYQSGGNMHRQPIYYTQNTNQIQMRMPQQHSPGIRHAQSEQTIVYDNFNPPPPPALIHSPRLNIHPQHTLEIQQQQPQQPHYQGQPPQQNFHQQSPHHHVPQQHHIQPQASQHSKPPQTSLISPTRSQIQSNVPTSGKSGYQVRTARILFNNQQEPKAINVRPRMTGQHQVRGPVMPIHSQSQPQPHPSIFDPTQDSNLAQIKAKVPVVAEAFNYYGYDPKETIPKDLPFQGCTFKLIDYEDVHPKSKADWCNAIKAAGGIFVEDLQDVTILICENRLSSLYSEAIKLGIRCATIYWINDVFGQSRLSYPWRALHLPVPFSKDEKPLKNHIIGITNLEGKERREVMEMILKTGAKYTKYFSQNNTLLICGNVGGNKYERAVEYKVPIANCRILNDIILKGCEQGLNVMLAQTKYRLFNRGDPLKLTTYSDIKELMSPWTKPIVLKEKKDGDNSVGLMNGASKSLDATVNTSEGSGIQFCKGNPNNDLKENTNVKAEVDPTPNFSTDTKKDQDQLENAKPTEETVGKATNPVTKRLRKSDDPIRLLFTHLETSLAEQLKKYASELGLVFANGPTNCTHLIVDRISRTHKFICAFSHATYILSHRWLIESHEAKNLLDEKQFILQDENGESEFSFNLAYSLMKRKKYGRLIFDGFIFFVTPTILDEVSNLKEMIESAGATIATKKLPTKLQLIDMRAEKKRFVVVTCEQDLHLCSALDTTIPRVGVEFILSGILRQDIDFEAHSINDTTFRKKARLQD